MLAQVAIKNFQSLSEVNLELGRFTVIVGPSSSGKSALLRALRVLASNGRGSAYVSHGAKIASVRVGDQDWTATLERGEGHGVYHLLSGQQERTFSKFGTGVPPEVTQVLGIEPATVDGSLNFAGQFDRPYLLDDSGAQVARTLGELTNVSIIFEASREANRLRLAASHMLRTRQADLAGLQTQAQSFRYLPDQIGALVQAEDALATAGQLSSRTERLGLIIGELDIAESVLARIADSVEIPDLLPVTEAQNRLAIFKDALTENSQQTRIQSQALAEADSASRSEVQLTEELHTVLHEAGSCPLCGQSTKEMAVVSEVR